MKTVIFVLTVFSVSDACNPLLGELDNQTISYHNTMQECIEQQKLLTLKLDKSFDVKLELDCVPVKVNNE